MRAAVTEGAGLMAVRTRPDPGPPGHGEVALRPEAVGICGSDYHFFTGDMSEAAGGLLAGQRVCVWPLQACGRCYPCRIGRPSACAAFRLTGIHRDGGLAECLVIGQEQVVAVLVDDPAIAALAEPVSIAVRAANRAGLTAGEHAVVLGAGPIGQSIGLVARERGARVLMVDLHEGRLALSRQLGAETVRWRDAEQVVAFARTWAGQCGPPVVFDATGTAQAVQAMVAMVSRAGRAVQVGMSNDQALIRVGSLTEKELDLLGVSCCDAAEFAEAVAVVERNAQTLAPLISHEFGLEEAPAAMRFAIDHPAQVMKVMIRCG